MATKNGVPFRQMLVPSSKYGLKCPNAMTPKKITIHNTDNQMPAENEISYMRNNNNQVSYHIAIDEKEAIQGLPFNRNGWHAGDGGNGYGNRNTIGVEMCRNYDRSRKTTNLNDPLRTQFKKAFNNTIKVVAQLCVDLGIVANTSNIKQHKDWSGKHCPSKILNDKTWGELVNGIIKEYNRLKGKPASKPQLTPSKPTGGTYKVVKSIGGYTTAADAKANKNKKTSVKVGTHHIFNESGGMINVTAKKGVPGSWINPADNKMESKPTPAKPATSLKVGGKVTLSKNASKYVTGEAIPASVKGKTYTIQQLKGDRVLLKEIYSWVYAKDVGGSGGSTAGTASKPKTFKVGGKVKIKSSAKKYATGETIPSRYKNKSYTIQQVKTDRVLLKELYSWVRKSDLQ